MKIVLSNEFDELDKNELHIEFDEVCNSCYLPRERIYRITQHLVRRITSHCDNNSILFYSVNSIVT